MKKYKTITQYGLSALAFLAPIMGWLAHNSMIQHEHSSVLGWAVLIGWGGVCAVGALAVDEL